MHSFSQGPIFEMYKSNHHECINHIFFIIPFFLISNSEIKPVDPPVELGKVKWQRNFKAGLEQSTITDKPVFILFQEVPGCGTCQRYGQQVLSHPLIVEAIEDLFVPVAIYNNKGGEDRKVLEYFGEPSWNNPVVRIVNAQKQDLVNRVNGNYTLHGVVQAMVFALTAARRPIPEYLRLLEEELNSKKTGTETAYLSMYCFWTGEKELGQMPGVIATQPGFMHGHEVVQVEYDPKQIELDQMVKQAESANCADQVYVDGGAQRQAVKKVKSEDNIRSSSKFRLDREPKYYLSKSIYRHVPMTALQAARANSLVGQRINPEEVLSPKQIALVRQIKENSNKAWPDLINVDLVKAWKQVEKVKS